MRIISGTLRLSSRSRLLQLYRSQRCTFSIISPSRMKQRSVVSSFILTPSSSPNGQKVAIFHRSNEVRTYQYIPSPPNSPALITKCQTEANGQPAPAASPPQTPLLSPPPSAKSKKRPNSIPNTSQVPERAARLR